MNTILFYVWCGFALGTAGLALFRKFVAGHEDDYIHVGPGQEKLIQEQRAVAQKLAAVDRWGKALTGVTVALGLATVAVMLTQAWMSFR